ncbi:possible gas vesicle synthesis protein [[Actinomadura] parvosata subsp. kistnae]|uniref:Gas vesicle protein G n=2 Tax=Nonomuraea TaxID=83681 RepID=A0A1V0A992_9ACTN|nr:gas vesicle protein GvpG [Nonomuraea sp. ATCC 55076]AQZ66712.1 gas vesicle protein G [Nonomuraea sp. ATCC 55076]NJP93468.1 gas vesicle protein G [Nonomuraea sp. FMUSA5-5]SPL95169.1 possible gas vesicle synthesis protein [Actinomadura parvosata subsp. kistnae]
MGLVSSIFAWPMLPVKGLIRLAEMIQDQADRELRNPAAVRRRLEEIEAARAAGQITEEEEQQAVERVLRLATGR